ncbi:MAG: hypothetical protein JSU75_04835 [Gammaproteobacteria bacterium]|nr:MAG: hypothetical protein JSU75_04835 [Gammaproteobacteria bacterium]
MAIVMMPVQFPAQFNARLLHSNGKLPIEFVEARPGKGGLERPVVTEVRLLCRVTINSDAHLSLIQDILQAQQAINYCILAGYE